MSDGSFLFVQYFIGVHSYKYAPSLELYHVGETVLSFTLFFNSTKTHCSFEGFDEMTILYNELNKII